MAKIGYVRSLEINSSKLQREKLKKYGCKKIYHELISSKKREKYRLLISSLQKNDVIVVTSIDRIAISLSNLYNLITELTKLDCNLVVLDQPSLNIKSSNFVDVVTKLNEMERINRKEFTKRGRQVAHERGVYLGRPHGLTEKSVERIKEIDYLINSEGLNITQIAKRFNTCRAQIYHLIKKSQEIKNI